jgi:hypothetical protein
VLRLTLALTSTAKGKVSVAPSLGPTHVRVASETEGGEIISSWTGMHRKGEEGQ